MKESTKSTLDAVVRTLNKITVNGRENLDMLLGCILAIEKIDEPVETAEKEEEA